MNTHSRIGMLSQYRTSRVWPQTGVPRGPMSPFLVFGFLAVWCLLLFAAPAMAQSELASLTGIVSDPSGSVISGAAIKVTQETTNISSSLTTNADGRYVAPALKAGVYRVSVSHPGFKSVEHSGVTLQVNQTARLDLQLEVGDVAEQISVTAETPLLQTETSNRGEVIDERKIVELPLNGRDYNQLALLSVGVLAPTPRLQSIGFKGAFNVNGNRAFHNAFRLDGVDNTSYSNSYRGGNVQVIQPSIEALQEFKIQTNAYGAEFGRSSGALINAVIKSGGNEVHGAAYEFHRNDNLDATNFFANKSGAEEPFRLRNQFGGAIGGPIVKDRTFIFGDYEGLRDRAGVVRFSSVAQSAWRQGRFSVPLKNPFNPSDTGTDFRQPASADCNDGNGNCWVIPQSLIDPVGRAVMDVSPDPNTGAAGQVDNNYVNVPVEPNRTDQFDIRLDHMYSNVAFFGRYSFSDTEAFRPAPRPGLAEGSFNDTFGTADWRSQAIAFGATWTLSPALVSEFRLGWTMGDFYAFPPNFGSGCPGELIGLKGSVTDESICGGIPVMNFPGGTLRRIGRTTSVPQFQTPRSYNIRDSFAWVKNNHTWKFGGEIVHVETGSRDVSNLIGSFSWSGRYTDQNGQWQGAIADLLLGFPSSYGQDSNTVFNLYQKIYSLYAQDDWKVAQNLTLNLGLRWEFATPPRDRNQFMANFDPTTQSFISAQHGNLFSESLINPDYNNFGPRIGFSYSPASRTVLRGAYGVFYNHTNRLGREGMLGFNPPFIVLANANNAGSGRLTATDALFRLQDGIPEGFVDLSRVDLRTVSRKGQDLNQRSSYVQQWNFGIQQEVVRDVLFDIAYVGNRGTKLAAFSNLNQRAVSFNAATGAPVAGARPLAGAGLDGDIQYLANQGISNYHSLQVRIEKRFSDGLSGLVSYTWGKALTDAVDHLSTSGAGNGVDVGVSRTPQNPFDRAAEYGPAEFDVTQRFVTSAVWEIPYGRGRAHGSNVNRGLDALFGGWQISPIITIQSGLALTVNQSGLFNIGGERSNRPNRIADGNLPASEQTVDRFFDTEAFVVLDPTPGRTGFVPNQAFGDSGIGILRGPNMINVDLNIAKSFSLTERQSLQFRAEMFNTFNHTNFSVPGINMGAGFGQIVSTATEARIIQLALKYRF